MQIRPIRLDIALLAFAACLFVFHHVPSFAGDRAGDWIDLITPFAVVATTAVALTSIAVAPRAVLLALLGAVLYVDGHGIHLAANSIGHEALAGDAKDVTHFWDETFGHIEWHLGWMTLAAALALAEASSGAARRFRPSSYLTAAMTVVLLGFTLFSSTVEGGTWWLELGAAAVFAVWAVRAPRPLLTTCAGAFALAALLIGVWAIWHGGVPEFSEVGWL
jgi:hypothetical protein